MLEKRKKENQVRLWIEAEKERLLQRAYDCEKYQKDRTSEYCLCTRFQNPRSDSFHPRYRHYVDGGICRCGRLCTGNSEFNA